MTDGVYFPRTRFYFSGHVTKPIEYQLSFQDSFGSFHILNAFLHFNFDKRLQFRFGRFKTRYTYEFYKMNIWKLYAPERSLFAGNSGLGRQPGAMFAGELFNERLEYGVGAFDGQRGAYYATKNTPDTIGFLNFRPFGRTPENSWLSWLKELNVGGSADYGVEHNPADSSALRTSANALDEQLPTSSAYNAANPAFLSFNDNVYERGTRSLMSFDSQNR